MHFTLILDHEVEKEARRLSPHMSAFNLKAPGEVAGNISLSKPIVSMLVNWFKADVEVDAHKVELMKAFV